ncbi:MAG: acyl-CoA dehydrogenase family protein [Lautropia sp.]
MDFELSEEQRQLADSLERLLNQQYGLERRKAILAAGGHSAEIWSRIAELGVLALPVSEAGGGFGGGAVDLMRPAALIGSALVVEPVIAHLSAARLLDRCATAVGGTAGEALFALLQQATAGGVRLAWADAAGDGALAAGATAGCSVRADGDGWRLDGRIDGVAGAGPGATLLVTARRSDGGRLLFVLPQDGGGARISVDPGLDNQRVATIEFAGVRLPAAARIGGDHDAAAIAAALDDAAAFRDALLCAEAVGLIEFACATTLDYLKTRKQFGVPIGSFQALQHRIVDLHVELEQVRSMAALACSKVDTAAAGQVDAADRDRSVAAARVLIGKVADRVAQESVQLHGGMGMTDELKISHTFRRLTVLARQGGTVGYFLDRFLAASRPL